MPAFNIQAQVNTLVVGSNSVAVQVQSAAGNVPGGLVDIFAGVWCLLLNRHFGGAQTGATGSDFTPCLVCSEKKT
jgi:hypothetical protein